MNFYLDTLVVNDNSAVRNGPYKEDFIKKWLARAVVENSQAAVKWTLVDEDENVHTDY